MCSEYCLKIKPGRNLQIRCVNNCAIMGYNGTVEGRYPGGGGAGGSQRSASRGEPSCCLPGQLSGIEVNCRGFKYTHAIKEKHQRERRGRTEREEK